MSWSCQESGIAAHVGCVMLRRAGDGGGNPSLPACGAIKGGHRRNGKVASQLATQWNLQRLRRAVAVNGDDGGFLRRAHQVSQRAVGVVGEQEAQFAIAEDIVLTAQARQRSVVPPEIPALPPAPQGCCPCWWPHFGGGGGGYFRFRRWLCSHPAAAPVTAPPSCQGKVRRSSGSSSPVGATSSP